MSCRSRGRAFQQRAGWTGERHGGQRPAAPDGGYDLLAVMQTASLDQATVHFKSAAGPALSIQPLPYTV